MIAPSPPATRVGEREWLLTAPWWHWPAGEGVAGAPRQPAIQKYASAELVTEFLADPQRRLVIDPVADRTQPPVWNPSLMPAPALAGPVVQPKRSLLKVYLPVHHRHYLVAVEVHCDSPGLPSVCREDVCEAGFVIRRRAADIPDEHASEAQLRMRQLARSRAELGVVDRRLRQAADAGRIGRARFDALAQRRSVLVTALDDAEAALQDWAGTVGATRSLLGWTPLGVGEDRHPRPLPATAAAQAAAGLHPLPGFGRWVPVAETPDELIEQVHPLFPLIPDPTAEPPGGRHDADGRTVYFGILPATSADWELLAPVGPDDPPRPRGTQDRRPRFDDLSTYEIRCVVRRHDPSCPRRPGRRDCCGPLVFSAPTAGYRLANPMDARGTAHRPVTVLLPSKDELRRDATATVGMGGMRIGSPDFSIDPSGDGGGFQICSFGIPLLTIVATFVLKLFLPIVTLVLGLWFLLAFRLCIPPSVDLSGGAKGELDALEPDFEADAAFEVAWDGRHPGDRIGDALKGGATSVTDGLKKSGLDPSPAPKSDGSEPADPADRFRLFRALRAGQFSSPNDDLAYAPRVQRSAVPVP